jgi:hypothetical protein
VDSFGTSMVSSAYMGLGISLNPADIFKIFSERSSRTRLQIASWLDEVAKEARDLADIWKKTDVALVEAV